MKTAMRRKIYKLKPKTGLIGLLLFCIVSAPTWANERDYLFKAEYTSKIDGFSIKLTRTLVQRDNGDYELKSYAKSGFYWLEEKSVFRKLESEFQPLSYTYTRNIFGIKTEEKIIYNWENKRAKYTHSKKSERNSTHPIELGVLDPALYLLKLQSDLYNKKEDLTYTYVLRKRIVTRQVVRGDKTTYEQDGKQYEAFSLSKTRKKRKTTIIVVPDFLFQVVLIDQIEKDGKSYHSELKEIDINHDRLEDFYSL